MAKLADILQHESVRDTEEQWGIIHLFKTGPFYSAYEWSAWLIAVITFNDEVRMATKDRKPIVVTRLPMKDSEDTFCRVGFPLKSMEKYIPTRLDYQGEDDKHIIVKVELPQPKDGSAITYERLAEAVKKWKESQPIKQSKDKKDSDPQEDTDRQPEPGQPKPKNTKTTTTQPMTEAGGGLISQIVAYPLTTSTPIENFKFIERLKQQIAAIL